MWVIVDSLLAHQAQQITSQTPTSPDVQATSAAVTNTCSNQAQCDKAERLFVFLCVGPTM